MLIYVDIDETICFYNGGRDYNDAIHSKKNKAKINKLEDVFGLYDEELIDEIIRLSGN